MSSKFITSICAVFAAFIISPVSAANQWTLQSSITQAMSVSPELKKSEAAIGSRNADVALSTMWPDPSIELKIDNQIGRDEGTGDYGFSEFTITQDIPLSRIKYQKRVAEAFLSSAKYAQNNDLLQLQNRVAKIFYELQLASAEYELAGKRTKLADKLNTSAIKNKQGTVVRYLTQLERMRLKIILEKAHQDESAAEGKLREIRNEFYKLLVLNVGSDVSVPQLLPIDHIPELNELVEIQNKHPLLSSQLQKLQAATNEIDVARSSITKDPSISLNRLRENFNSGTESVYGIMVNFEIPIYNRKSSVVSKANYNASQQRIELARLKRNLQINLDKSFTHLNHVMAQAFEYKKKVLKPASQILDLSKKGFISGELNILSLIDANNTYFDSHIEYLNLIYQSRMELADINFYAGKFLNNKDFEVSTNNIGGQ